MEFALYGYFRSSASYRVRIALELKGIKYDYKAVSLIKNGGEQFGEEYKKLNPLAQVPSLLHDNKVISQSVAIIDYLDAVKPEPSLFPKDASGRATVLQLCEVINSGIQPLQNQSTTKELERSFGFSTQDSDRWRRYWIERGLSSFDKMLESTAGRYCFGDSVTAADCFLVPQIFSAERFGADLNLFKTAAAINERLLALPAFQAAHPSKQPDASG